MLQINDTHPALVIPELMRIFMDEAGMSWDEAWDIASHSVAYTNHTVLAEALERWPQQLVESLLPRVWQIMQEIAHRWQTKVENFYHDPAKTEKMAILWGGEVRMANLCIAGCLSVNGVSGLHSEILKKMCSKTPAPWSRGNLPTSPTASTTAAGSARSIPVWMHWCGISPAGTTICSIRRP